MANNKISEGLKRYWASGAAASRRAKDNATAAAMRVGSAVKSAADRNKDGSVNMADLKKGYQQIRSAAQRSPKNNTMNINDGPKMPSNVAANRQFTRAYNQELNKIPGPSAGVFVDNATRRSAQVVSPRSNLTDSTNIFRNLRQRANEGASQNYTAARNARAGWGRSNSQSASNSFTSRVSNSTMGQAVQRRVGAVSASANATKNNITSAVTNSQLANDLRYMRNIVRSSRSGNR
jgi:hypothetical protein